MVILRRYHIGALFEKERSRISPEGIGKFTHKFCTQLGVHTAVPEIDLRFGNQFGVRFPSTLSHRIQAHAALFPCQTQVQVPERLPIYWVNHYLPEIVIYLHYDFDRRIIVIEWPFISRTPLENTKEGKIKDLEDRSCMWCKSHDAHPCLSENKNHIIADMSRTMIHQ
jgi:hypothetical protein